MNGVVSLDCSDAVGPASPAPQSLSASANAPLGFEARGICVGACPPTTPLRSGETKGGPISLGVTLPNGDRFAFTGEMMSGSQGVMLAYESPFAAQYLGNASTARRRTIFSPPRSTVRSRSDATARSTSNQSTGPR